MTVRAPARRARLGFLGTGWIGRDRLEAIVRADVADTVLVADPDPGSRDAAIAAAPGAGAADDLEAMLGAGLDGLVIATPSALHAEQAIAALDAGCAVFCQKPLGRDAAEAAAVVAAAQRADRLLGVDLSYRHTAAAIAVRDAVRAGDCGTVHAVDLVFHNAYGPDKPWYLDPERSGGGCVVDLGIHLVDLVLWTLDWPAVRHVHAHRFLHGVPAGVGKAEDLCLATLELEGGTVVRLACSWFSHEGRDAVIEATFRGSNGAAALHNVDGSFLDLAAERRTGTARHPLVVPPDDWGGRAAVDWTRRLSAGARFDPAAARHVAVAEVLDRIGGA